MLRLSIGVLLAGLVVCANAQTTGPLAVEDRTASSKAANAEVSDDGVMLLMQQLQLQEQELATLRGHIEELRQQLDMMRQAERDRFIDLDTRINALASSAAPATAAAATAEPAETAGDAASSSPEAERAAYAAAKEKLVSGNYDAAAKAFEGYLSEYPEGQFASYSHFWLGETYRGMAKPQPQQAIKHFTAVIERFPDSGKASAAMYKLAVLEYESGEVTRAKVTLNKLIKQFPASSDAGLAKSMLAQLK